MQDLLHIYSYLHSAWYSCISNADAINKLNILSVWPGKQSPMFIQINPIHQKHALKNNVNVNPNCPTELDI